MLVLSLMYSDFAGHTYVSDNTVAWNLKDGGTIVRVKPGAIRKLYTDEAKKFAEGAYILGVAGLNPQINKSATA
jgi:hypothetical protein